MRKVSFLSPLSSLINLLSGSRYLGRPHFGEGGDEVEDGAKLGQAHAVAVEEFLQGEVVVERFGAVLGEVLGQLGDELAVGALQDRHGAAAAVGQLGELLLPAGQERLPARRGVVGGGGGAQ